MKQIRLKETIQKAGETTYTIINNQIKNFVIDSVVVVLRNNNRHQEIYYTDENFNRYSIYYCFNSELIASNHIEKKDL